MVWVKPNTPNMGKKQSRYDPPSEESVSALTCCSCPQSVSFGGSRPPCLVLGEWNPPPPPSLTKELNALKQHSLVYFYYLGRYRFPHLTQKEGNVLFNDTLNIFFYGYMASDIWLWTILIVRKETRCRHIGYSLRLTARVLLYAPSQRQDSTYHGLCYTSRGALAGTRNRSMGPLTRSLQTVSVVR